MQDAFVAAAVEWDRRGVPDRPGAWLTTDGVAPGARPPAPRPRRRRPRPRPRPCRELRPRTRLRALRARRRRPAAHALHLLPSGARRRRAHGAHAAQRRRAHRARDRARLPVERERDGAAPGARAAQGHPRADPVPRPARRPAARAARRRAARRLPRSTPRATRRRAAPRRVRGDLCEEAIRLARLLARLMPDEAEALGLLALLLLTDARRAARVRGDGVARRRSRSRTGRRGTRPRIADGTASSSARCGWAAPGRTSCRRRSRRCTRGAGLGGDRLAADRRALRASSSGSTPRPW